MVEMVVLFIGRGVANGRNGLVLERYGRNGGPVHREGCGVPQNGTPWDIVHLHYRPPPASTGYCSSIVDLLQPPHAIVHPRAPIHPASIARYSIGYCSTTPPLSTVHPALHTTGSCSNTLKEICPRGNNKVLFISLYHDKCLLFMLELY